MAYKQKSDWNTLMGNPHIDPPKTSSQTALGASLNVGSKNGPAPPPNKKPAGTVTIGNRSYINIDEALNTYNKYQDKQAETPGLISKGAHTIKYEKDETDPKSKPMNPDFQQYGQKLTYTGQSSAVSSDDLKKRSIEHLGSDNEDIGAISTYIASHPSISSIYSKRYKDESGQTYHSQQYGFKPHEKFIDSDLTSTTEDVPEKRGPQGTLDFRKRHNKNPDYRGKKYLKAGNIHARLRKLGIETFGNRRFEYEGDTIREQKKNYRADKRDDIPGFGDKAKKESVTKYYTRGKEKKKWTQKDYDAAIVRNDVKKAEYNKNLKLINKDRISFGRTPFPLAK